MFYINSLTWIVVLCRLRGVHGPSMLVDDLLQFIGHGRNPVSWNKEGGQIEKVQKHFVTVTESTKSFAFSNWQIENGFICWSLPQGWSKILIPRRPTRSELLRTNHPLHHYHVVVCQRRNHNRSLINYLNTSSLHLHFVINESMSMRSIRIWCGWLNLGSSL